MDFAAATGYMPVVNAAFDAIADYPFPQQSYQRLYDVYNQMRAEDTPLSEPAMVGYHARAKVLYDQLRQRQKQYPQRLADGGGAGCAGRGDMATAVRGHLTCAPAGKEEHK